MFHRFLKFSSALVVASIISAVTLWLLVDPFKYVLFIYEVGLIVSLFIFFEYRNIRISFAQMKIINRERMNFSMLFDFLLVGGSLFLLLSESLNMEGNLSLLVVTLAMTAFGSGYSLLNLLGMTKYFSKLELMVLSYVMSLLITGLLFFVGIWIPLLKDYILSVPFLFLCLFSAIKNRIRPNTASRRSFSQPKDLLLILMAVAFYVILYAFLFPKFATSIHTDGSGLYRLSVILPRAPGLFYAMDYVLLLLFQSSVLFLSKADMISSQIAIGFLPLMLIPACYVMMKEYLEHVDIHLPSLSTLFWTIFGSGLFGWLYYLQLQLSSNNLSVFSLLSITASYTYYSTMYGIFGFTFVGYIISFTAMFIAIFLLKRFDIPKFKFYFLFSSLIIIMFLSHVTEAVVITFFLILWGIISSNNSSIRIGDAIKSSLIAFIIIITFYVIASQIFTVFWTFQIITSLLAPTLSLAITIVYRRTNKLRIYYALNNIGQKIKNVKYKTTIIFLFIYILSSLTCLLSLGTFNTGQLGGMWNVPWFCYPLVLGLNGLLAIIASIFISRNEQAFKSYHFFIAFMLYSLIFGRVLSFINLNFFSTGYWESRFIYYMAISAAAMAPIPVIKFVSYIRNSFQKSTFRILLTVFLIGIIVASGALTTFLNIEYWSISSTVNQPDSVEMNATDAYREICATDPYAGSFTITPQSQATTVLSAPTGLLPPEDGILLGSAITPELALNILGIPWVSHFYLYMDTRDFSALNNNGWDAGYLAGHLIPMLPIVFKNSEVTIYNVSRIAPPLPFSDQILLFPFSPSTSMDENSLFCYDMLSQGLYNYTTAFDTDNSIMSASTLLLSFDPKEGNMQGPSIEDYTKFVDSGGNLIILNTDGFGTFAKMFFKSSNNTLEADYISDTPENLTLPKGSVVPMLEPVNETEEILSSFVSSNGTSPYITRMNIGEGQLFYVNVEPLTSYMNQTDSNKSEIYSIIGQLLNGIKLKPYEGLSLPASDGYVQEIDLDDSVSINTTSILFPSYADLVDDGYGEIRATSADGISVFYNVTSIQLNNYSQVTIQSSEATIKDGKSFYTQLSLNETTKLDFTPNAHLTVTSNDEQFEVANISTISIIMDNPIAIWARTPTIWADSGTFKKVYSLKGINGGDLVVRGGVTFSVTISDSYSSLNNFQINGSYTNPSQNYYNELQSLPLATVPACILTVLFACILLPVWLMRRKHKRIRFQMKRRKTI